MTVAPTYDPSSVPMPPTMAISSPCTDWAKAMVDGLTKLLKMAYSAPRYAGEKSPTR